MLPGPGGVIGDALVADPHTAKISFTGETTTGASILKASADHIARVSLELGGKSAAIVFADANVQKAAADAPLSVFGNAGQDCCARARILVQRSAYEEFVEAFDTATRALKVGDPLEGGHRDGPDDLRQPAPGRSLDYLGIGTAEGARLVSGGGAQGATAST